MCPCDEPVYLLAMAMASSNCHGTSCVVFDLTNLALNIVGFAVYRGESDQVCFQWEMNEALPAYSYLFETSYDGINFNPLANSLTHQLNKTGTFFNACFNYTGQDTYYRLKMTGENGQSVYSPIKRLVNEPVSMRLQWIQVGHRIIILDHDDEFQTRRLELFNLNGQLVYNQTTHSNEIDLPESFRGIYYIRILSGTRLGVKSLIL
jgi:hypothetical protein